MRAPTSESQPASLQRPMTKAPLLPPAKALSTWLTSRLRRPQGHWSTNNGATWDTPTTVTVEADSFLDDFSLTASANHAYLVYSDVNTAVGVWAWSDIGERSTAEQRGAVPAQITASDWKTDHPSADLYNGALYLTYDRKASGHLSVYFQKSTDGLHWSTPQLVDQYGNSPFVGYAGKVVVLLLAGRTLRSGPAADGGLEVGVAASLGGHAD